jgi:hypothetical protein
MKRLIFVIVLLVSGNAWAQSRAAMPEVEVIGPRDSINIAVGQATKLRFPVPFDRIDLTSDTIAKANPITDQSLTLQGLSPGESLITVFSGARELWSGSVIVGAERGHTVKLYDGKSKDFTGYYCTDVGCGRADKELNGAREVSSVTTVIGGVARTVTYGGKGN